MDKTATKIIELKNDGKSLRQIAKQVGTSHVAVKKRLDRLTTNETGNQESETHGNAIAEPVNGDCQAPPPDKGQLYGTWANIPSLTMLSLKLTAF